MSACPHVRILLFGQMTTNPDIISNVYNCPGTTVRQKTDHEPGSSPPRNRPRNWWSPVRGRLTAVFAAISSQGLLVLKDAYYGTLKAFAAGTWTYDALGN